MAVTEAYVGNGVTIGTTEWSMSTNTSGPNQTAAAGVFQLFMNLQNIALGDEFQVKLYETINGTPRLVEKWNFGGPQLTVGWASPAMMLINGWDWTVKKIAGTDRSIDWSIRKA